MDRWDFPAVHLRNISQMRHIGKVPFGYGDGRFFNLAGPYRTDTAPGSSQREHADPVKKAPQLNVRHSPGCRVPSRQAPLPALSPQCPAARQPQYRFLHPRPQRCRRRSGYGSAAAYPGAYQSRPCVPRERCHSKTAADTRAGSCVLCGLFCYMISGLQNQIPKPYSMAFISLTIRVRISCSISLQSKRRR